MIGSVKIQIGDFDNLREKGINYDKLKSDFERLKNKYDITQSALSKYVKHVEFCEGITYLSNSKIKNTEINFTEDEFDILKSLE